MVSRRSVLLAMMLAVAPMASAQPSDPADPVRKLYATYGVGANDSRGFGEKDAKALLSKGLLALYQRASKAGLDADFFVQGQDFNLAKPVAIGKVEIDGDRARVAATLTQNDVDAKGKPKSRVDRFEFMVVRDGGAWKIDDVSHGKTSVRREWQATIRSGGMR